MTLDRGGALLRAVRIAAIGLLVILGISLAHADPAAAGPGDDPASVVATVDSAGGNCTPGRSDSNLLAINRWGDETSSFHTRLSSGLDFTSIADKVQRNGVQAMSFQAGTAMWSASTGLINWAAQFCILQTVGADADHTAAAIGNAIFQPTPGVPNIVALLVVCSILVFAWRAQKGQPGQWKAMIRPIGIIAIAVIMLQQADKTVATDGTDGVHGTDFATFSPGWIVSSAADTVSKLAAAPTNALINGSDGYSAGSTLSQGEGDSQNQGPGSCSVFLDNMHTAYVRSVSSVDAGAAKMPMVMSIMWENTGLVAWKNSQFGAGNTYGDRVFCHALDQAANMKEINGKDVDQTVVNGLDTQYLGTQWSLMQGAGSDALPGPGRENGFQPASVAMSMSTDSNNVIDRSIIGWAFCRWDGSAWGPIPLIPANQIKIGDAGKQITAEDCRDWYSSTGSDWSGSSGLDVTGDVGGDDPWNLDGSNPGEAEMLDFMTNWHGRSAAGSTGTALAYLIAALIMLIIFGIFAVAILFAKIVSVAMILFIFLALARSLLPTSSNDQALLGYAKFGLGATIIGFVYEFILALALVITGFMQRAGNAQFGTGTIMSIIWVGLSPALALLLINYIAKNALSMPSLLKVSTGTALASAVAGGAVGAAAGVGLERMYERGKSRVNQQRRNAQLGRTLGTGRSRAGSGPGTTRGVGGTMVDTAGGNGTAPGTEQLTRKQRREELANSRSGVIAPDGNGKAAWERPDATGVSLADRYGARKGDPGASRAQAAAGAVRRLTGAEKVGVASRLRTAAVSAGQSARANPAKAAARVATAAVLTTTAVATGGLTAPLLVGGAYGLKGGARRAAAVPERRRVMASAVITAHAQEVNRMRIAREQSHEEALVIEAERNAAAAAGAPAPATAAPASAQSAPALRQRPARPAGNGLTATRSAAQNKRRGR